MKSSTIKILVGILGVLLLITFSPQIGEKFKDKTQIKNDEIILNTFTKDTVSSVQIKKGKEEVILSKEGSGWNIASFSASSQKVDSFFSGLKEAKTGNIVSRNSQNLGEFSLASDSGTLITFQGQEGNHTFVIGKQGPETGSFYAKKEESQNVYVISSSLLDSLKTSTDDWRDKVVVNLSVTSPFFIEVSGEDWFTLNKKESGTWEVSSQGKTKEIGEAEIGIALSKFSPLEGREFLTTKEEQEFKNGTKKTILIKDKDKKVLDEIQFLEKDGDYWMKRNDKSDVLKVSGYKLQEFFALSSAVK